jgi:hypothetical protein
MPTVYQITSAKKKLRKVNKKPNNSPKVPNISTFRIISMDPKIQRTKEVKKLIAEMELRKKQYMNAMKKLKKNSRLNK